MINLRNQKFCIFGEPRNGPPYKRTGLAWIQCEIAFFHKQWCGWRRAIWWLYPFRWAVHRDYHNAHEVDYFVTANDAAQAMSRLVNKKCDPEVIQEVDY